jgi:protein-S-isoprenylcysteine O-methyltransferase Ste14
MEADELLLSLFGCLVAAAIIARILIVYRRTGIFPVVLDSGDTPHNYIQTVNAVVFALSAVSIIFKAASDYYYVYLVPIPFLEIPAVQISGMILAYVSLFGAAVAQAQLGAAWRIGIDDKHDTALVTSGLYSVSRHPTYLAFMFMALGLFLAMPNAISLAACALALAILPIEARLEEEHLAARHGKPYTVYLSRTRRWL